LTKHNNKLHLAQTAMEEQCQMLAVDLISHVTGFIFRNIII